ncbi:ribbon-helix-helix protein, CopG family [Anaerococcus obesiensis]
MKTITIRLDDELHKKFKLFALENNKSMQEIIEEYIKKIIKEKNK